MKGMATWAVLAGLVACAANAAPVGTAFTYQGSLRDSGQPASGGYDFEFRLYDAEAGGSQVGLPVGREDVAVSAGWFSVELDFGAAQFAGDAQWLQVAVRPGISTGAYTTLQPRQPVTPVPYALGAVNALANSVTGTSVVDGSIGSADVNLQQVQARASASCPRDMSLRGIGADGAPICNDAVAVIDADGHTGNPSGHVYVGQGLVMDAGVPIGIFALNLTGSVRTFLSCDNAVCSRIGERNAVGVSSPNQFGADAAVVNGIPIAVADYGGNLNFLRCSDRVCTTSTPSVLTTGGTTVVSLGVTASGVPRVSYTDAVPALKLFVCAAADCVGVGTVRTLAATATIWHQLEMRPDGRPLVFFQNSTLDAAVYDCADATCSSGTTRILDATGNRGQVITSARLPGGGWFAFYTDSTLGEIRGYECTDVDCTGGSAFTVAPGLRAIEAVARQGQPPLLIAFDPLDGEHFAISCLGPACSPATTVSLGNADVRSTAVRSDGRPVLVRSWFGDSYLHTCGRPDCSP